MRKKKSDAEPKTPLSGRLNEAMTVHTNEAWAEKLGFTRGNVSHWRTGRHSPDVETILSIARIAGASDYFLLTGKPDPQLTFARLRAAMEQFREAVTHGEEPGEAWGRVLGQPGLLSEEEREVLSGDPEGLRVYLTSESGFEQFSLNEDQQQVVRDLMRLLARYRDRPGEPDDSGPAPAL